MLRSRWYCALTWSVLLAGCSVLAYGQDAGPKVIKLDLTPTPAPEPALRYVLIPELSDQVPGNADALFHLACELLPKSDAQKKTAERIHQWLDEPADKLPRDEVKAALAEYENAIRYTTLGSHREYCHFDLPIRQERMNTMLPNLGALRDIARALALRIRLATMEGRYEDAVNDLQTGVVLARYIAGGPTLLHGLVAAAIGNVMCDQMANLVGAPGAPNLYWALANVPRPVIDPSTPFHGEHGWMAINYPRLFELDRVVLSRSDIDQLIAEFVRVGETGAGLPEDGVKLLKEARTELPKMLEPARKYLLAHGYTAQKLATLPPEQIVLMHAMARATHWMDEERKWLGLPYWQGAEPVAKVEAAFEAKRKDPAEGFLVMAGLPVGLSRVYAVFALAQRRFDAIQCIEAIRLYAAANDGALPPTLAAITEMPVPLDPVTGQAFSYRVQDGVGVLELPAPPTAAQWYPRAKQPDELAAGRRYELRIRSAAPVKGK